MQFNYSLKVKGNQGFEEIQSRWCICHESKSGRAICKPEKPFDLVSDCRHIHIANPIEIALTLLKRKMPVKRGQVNPYYRAPQSKMWVKVRVLPKWYNKNGKSFQKVFLVYQNGHKLYKYELYEKYGEFVYRNQDLDRNSENEILFICIRGNCSVKDFPCLAAISIPRALFTVLSDLRIFLSGHHC